MAQEPLKLCDLDQIPDGDSGGFYAERDGKRRGYIVVRRGEQAFVYLNSCPHVGSPLDFAPGKFLNPEKTMILCSTHGALFRIDDGHCVAGPCADQALTRASTEVRDGAIFLL